VLKGVRRGGSRDAIKWLRMPLVWGLRKSRHASQPVNLGRVAIGGALRTEGRFGALLQQSAPTMILFRTSTTTAIFVKKSALTNTLGGADFEIMVMKTIPPVSCH